jgi:hypothetical protein
MHSPCPVADTEQMDFFGSLSPSASSALPNSEDEESAVEGKKLSAPGERVESRTREPQLSLGLPSLPLNQFEWTDQQLCAFRDGVLVAQLRLLNDERTTPQLRAELIEWIAAPKRNEVELRTAPLSFQACCLSAGVDFEEMRERTLFLVAQQLRKKLDVPTQADGHGAGGSSKSFREFVRVTELIEQLD